jgi:hypothetical protein
MSLKPSLCTTSSHWVLQWYSSPKKRSTDKHVTHTQSLYYIITLTFYSGIIHRNNGPQINMSLAPSLCTTSSPWDLHWYSSPKQRSTDKHVTQTQSLYYIITLTFYSGIAHRNNGPQINVVQRLGVSDMFICEKLFRWAIPLWNISVMM